MKKLTLLIVSIILGLFIQAQDYMIDFTASGITNTLDSVHVKNLTQQTELILNGSDTLHLRKSSSGIHQKLTNPIQLSFYPNPLRNGQGTISIVQDIAGDMNIKIYDMEGKMIMSKKKYVQVGHNDFLIKGLSSGFFMLNVKTNSYSESVKLISIDGKHGIPQMEFVQNKPGIANKASITHTKSIKYTIAMQYNDGEALKMTGYADSLVSVDTIIPTQSQTVNFHFGSTYPSGTVHCIPGGAAVVDVTNLTTGEIWMDRNLGASQQATASTDSQAYGDLYQWGRFSDGHQCRNSSTTNTNATTATPNASNSWDGKFITENSSPYDWLIPQNDNLWHGVNGTNNPCPSGYRLPTKNEFNNERFSWSSNNAAGAYGSPLKLPLAGRRQNSNGSLYDVGSYGLYWSSTVSGTRAVDLYFLNSGSNGASMSWLYRARGHSVRCLKD